MSIKIYEARICKGCENLVTGDAICPLCGKPTEEHHDRADVNGYCQHCGNEFASSQLEVVTWDEDPYWQTEDGDLNLICLQCNKDEEEDLG